MANTAAIWSKAFHRSYFPGIRTPIDKPHLRIGSLEADIRAGNEREFLARRRIAALKRHGRPGKEQGPPALKPVPGASNWVQVGPMSTTNGPPYAKNLQFWTGRISSILIDPTAAGTMYIGAAKGGVWKTTDGGKKWAPMSDDEMSLAIGAMALAPNDAQTVYAGTGEGNIFYVVNVPDSTQESYYGAGFLKSTNGGTSWNLYGQAEFTGGAFFRIAVHPANPSRVWAATSNGLFLSDSGGTSWTPVTNGLPPIVPGTFTGSTEIVLHPTDPAIAFTYFVNGGIYRSTNANGVSPAFVQVPAALPLTQVRGSIAFSPSQPLRMMAAVSGELWFSTDGGQNWQPTGAAPVNCTTYDYGNHVAIDPVDPNIVYLSGIPQLNKFTFDPVAMTWSSGIIGQGTTHADHHFLAIDPANHLHLYAGTDGGIYESSDGGGSWSDGINRGLCITQFEFLDHHPTSDAVLFGGTQDNGTQQFRNSTVFPVASGGDGGFTAVDFNNPHNVLLEHYYASPERSTQAGEYLTFTDISPGLSGVPLFYPPYALCAEDPDWIAFGTSVLFIDKAQGTGGWPTFVPLPGNTGSISAINFVSKTLIYCASIHGQVYAVRSMNGGVDWAAEPIYAAPFPARFVWDIGVMPNDSAHVIVVVSGYGTGHVWSGIVPQSGVAAWTDVSGSGVTAIPDVPANSLVIDPAAPSTYYVGTDIGVFRTMNAGGQWENFGQGLPNTAVYDMRLHGASHLLRAATHGRGVWERRVDVASLPDVDIYVRHHMMDSGRGLAPEGIPAAFKNIGQFIDLGDPQRHWMCADMKVDALLGNPLSYQYATSAVDFVVFEAQLVHRNAERGNVNHVFAQVHNRGIKAATVTVKLIFADSTAKVPPLPNDFWTAFPGNSAVPNTPWHPIGAAKTVTVTPTLPAVLEWDWLTPMGQPTHSCLLLVVDSADDPIPAAHKIFDVDALVKLDKRTGLKNLHIVDAPPKPPGPAPPPWSAAILDIIGPPSNETTLSFELLGGPDSALAFFLPRDMPPFSLPERSPLKITTPTTDQLEAARKVLGKSIDAYDTSRLYLAAGVRQAATPPFAIPERGLRLPILLSGTTRRGEIPPRFNVLQHFRRELLGGSTFVLVTRE
ncbi:MAG: hypothetical protein DMF56_10385 [Acidobacteria bacterium]|nr:MAG: hypothetical protein DMF56_10385 [Acidobacteriota bacterium]